MVYYCFALDEDGETEVLGGMPLADDDEAVDFAERIIRDLERERGEPARSLMLITEGKRIIRSIPFELGDNGNQRKSVGLRPPALRPHRPS